MMSRSSMSLVLVLVGCLMSEVQSFSSSSSSASSSKTNQPMSQERAPTTTRLHMAGEEKQESGELAGFLDNLLPTLPSNPFAGDADDGTSTTSASSPTITKPTSIPLEPFEYSPEALIRRAKLVIASDFGIQDNTLLADKDQFVWIGPLLEKSLGKVDYVAAGKFFNLRNAFPDLEYRAHDFRIDVNDPLTVRCTVRPVGVMRGSLRLRDQVVDANGQAWKGPPEAVSMTFDEESGQLTKLCSGFCLDRLVGNTNGLCGAQAAATVAGVPPSEWEVTPLPAVLSRFFGRPATPMQESSTFLAPFPETVMIQLAKGVLATNLAADDPSLLSKQFVYVTPSVGPVVKRQFLQKYATQEFGGFEPEVSGFRVDPYDPYRVWVDVKPVGPGLEGPPQAFSFAFDEDGFCTRMTGGAVMDPSIGNTGGLSGPAGIKYALGEGALDIATRPLPLAIGRLKKVVLSPFTKIGADDYRLDTGKPREVESDEGSVAGKANQKRLLAGATKKEESPVANAEKRISRPPPVVPSKPADDKPAKPFFALDSLQQSTPQTPKPATVKPPTFRQPPPAQDDKKAKAEETAAKLRLEKERLANQKKAALEEQKRIKEARLAEIERKKADQAAAKAAQQLQRQQEADARKQAAAEQQRIAREEKQQEAANRQRAQQQMQMQQGQASEQQKAADQLKRQQAAAAQKEAAAEKQRLFQEQKQQEAEQRQKDQEQKRRLAAEAVQAAAEKRREEAAEKRREEAEAKKAAAEEARLENMRQMKLNLEKKQAAAAEKQRQKKENMSSGVSKGRPSLSLFSAPKPNPSRPQTPPSSPSRGRPSLNIFASSPKKAAPPKKAGGPKAGTPKGRPSLNIFASSPKKAAPAPKPSAPSRPKSGSSKGRPSLNIFASSPAKKSPAQSPKGADSVAKARPTLSLFGGGAPKEKVAPSPPPLAGVSAGRPSLNIFAASPPKSSAVAPKGVPTIISWKQLPNGGISGQIYGAPDFRNGERVETSKISSGSIANGGVVTTSSGSRYFLSENTARQMKNVASTSPVKTAARPSIQIPTATKRKERATQAMSILEGKNKETKSRATFSLGALFGGGDDAASSDKNKAPSTPKARPSIRLPQKAPSTPKARPSITLPKKKSAPRGVPTIRRWRQNRDKSITGFISGSPAFDDGERITSSPISKGSVSAGEVVTTGSGSRYFLDY